MGFKGFDKIANLQYEQKVFLCKSCDNKCDVTLVNTEDGALYYGDRCEKYSGVAQKNDYKFRNLFELREKILESYSLSKPGNKKIGIPRVGMFYELFPLWSVFFNELGLDIIVSDETNKKIINDGLKKATTEFCYPFEVSFGHLANLNGKADFVFVPDVIHGYRTQYVSNGKVLYTDWDKSFTCPYLQNFGMVVSRNVSTSKVINPSISFRDGQKKIVTVLADSFRDIGLDFSNKEVRNSFVIAEEAYFSFKSKLKEEGKKTLEDLVEKQKGIVIVGRPYTAFDESTNLRIVEKILRYGFMPIPMDFLPLPEEDISHRWANEFSVQGQHILNAANVIRKLGLNSVFVDNFGCGPNAFIRKFFAYELGNKPFLDLQIDEHTADAGVETRKEAFLDTIR